jgi:UDP-N-acetylglucosamine--N-acetylmuramyl-(pentapeptide) pyrophosphoryl-undecaprenol N-acetylglucosamine transferase
MNNTLLIIGGGTGGHIAPGIALYEQCKEAGVPVVFLAGERDKRFSTLQDIGAGDLFFYNAPPFTMNLFRLPFFVLRYWLAMARAKRLIRQHRVTAVVGMGGYVSAPALSAAKRMGVAIYLCEQNAVPGKVTRVFEKHARRIYGTFAMARDYLKRPDIYVQLGNPIRTRVLVADSRDEARRSFHMQQSSRVLLVIGGSQGAVALNEMMYSVIRQYPEILKDTGIIWSTGDHSYHEFKEKAQGMVDEGAVYLSPYITNVGNAYRACDLAISRSGAGVMMELAAMGVPSILVPFPYSAMDHQDKNADEFVEQGASVKLVEKTTSPEELGRVIRELLDNQRTLKKMSDAALATARVNAAADIMNDIIGQG